MLLLFLLLLMLLLLLDDKNSRAESQIGHFRLMKERIRSYTLAQKYKWLWYSVLLVVAIGFNQKIERRRSNTPFY